MHIQAFALLWQYPTANDLCVEDIERYIAGKKREWDDYRTHVSDWELGKYLVIY